MKSFGKAEYQILELLYQRDVEKKPNCSLVSDAIHLKEKDEMNRIRELVFHIEELERDGYILTEPEFYDSSDHISFTYLNSATELREERIALSEEGLRLMETLQKHHTPDPIQSVSRVWGLPEGKAGAIYIGLAGLAIGLILGFFAGKLLG